MFIFIEAEEQTMPSETKKAYILKQFLLLVLQIGMRWQSQALFSTYRTELSQDHLSVIFTQNFKY